MNHHDREVLEADVANRLFRASQATALPDRVGFELELLPMAPVGSRVPVEGREGMRARLERLAARVNWTWNPEGTFQAPCGCRISFEPGGQLEVSTATAPTIDRAIDCLEAVHGPLTTLEGVELLALGYDPVTPLTKTTLQLSAERYRAMQAHFDARGDAGVRMMRQSCALQINLDLGARPFLRWNAANRIAPLLTAIFANSPMADGRDTGWRSVRAAQWLALDPSRTGVVGPGRAPVDEYLEYALAAEPFLTGSAPFVEGGQPTTAWRTHLSTLFPDVRPRGYLELRCLDTVPVEWLAAPLVFSLCLLYDEQALARVLEALPLPTAADRAGAARDGLADPRRRARACWAFELALEAGERLRPLHLGPDVWARAARYYEAFTARGLDLGSRPVPAAAVRQANGWAPAGPAGVTARRGGA
ncbi:MAG: glutamate-cysteine ligase family protein [Gemmatimonadota bacterium]